MRTKNRTLISTLCTTLLYIMTMSASAYAADAKSLLKTQGLDVEPPQIIHKPFTKSQKPGKALIIKAAITDNQGIQSVWLNYRVKGMENYRVLMMKLSKLSDSNYVGVIPASEVGMETIEYYIQATDTGGNTVLRGGMLFPLSIAFKQAPKFSNKSKLASNANTVETTGLFDLPKNSNQAWAWIAGGVLVGALIANSGGGSDSSAKPQGEGGTISVTGGGI